MGTPGAGSGWASALQVLSGGPAPQAQGTFFGAASGQTLLISCPTLAICPETGPSFALLLLRAYKREWKQERTPLWPKKVIKDLYLEHTKQ